MARQVALIARTPHEEKNPPLGRLEQLVDNPTADFVELVALKASLVKAVQYVAPTELERLKALDERRTQLVCKAFETARLPNALIAFEGLAYKHGLLKEANNEDARPISKIRLGGWRGFILSYKETSRGNKRVKVKSANIFGSTLMLDFNHTNEISRHRPNRFELISADARALDRSNELYLLMHATILEIEQDKLRKSVKQCLKQGMF